VTKSVISDQRSVIRKLTLSSGHWSLIADRCAAVAAVYFFALAVGAAAATAAAPPGAASCTGCHATSGKIDTRVPRIAGRNPAEIVAAMEAFRSGQKPATVMDRIAKGFSDAEIRAIADWLAAQN